MKQLLSDFLLSQEKESEPGGASLFECRHCGTKFDEDRNYCTACGKTEIATYSFDVNCGTADS